MAVHNGARFLEAQLASIQHQHMEHIDLWISDDGSEDRTGEIVAAFAREWNRGDVHSLHGPRNGFAENYRTLMTGPEVEADYVAFCDQDDVWDEDKLQAAIAWLATQPADHPALYCSRTRIITEDGEVIGTSPLFSREPAFRNALVQSIAGGNTMVMNRAAHAVVREASKRSSFVSHDWWCYQIITAVGGTVHYSSVPKVGYRQHDNNVVGENISWRARMSRLRLVVRGRFQKWNEQNVTALVACRDLLTPEARRIIEDFKEARGGRSLMERISALRRSGVYRQTPLGQVGLYIACALRKL